ncbi:MAG: segregation/condensation protein A [Planctomycetaceae bacterium]|jgi:segregation and condensation protein A|nr:segregation/condensation protein A [Planctomycetaceae bacterium]
MDEFKIDLRMFYGPLDLLYYLVRKNELEIQSIPIAAVTDQFMEYLAIPEQLDINSIGDFLALASTLVEMKSYQVLPNGEEIEEELENPRNDLVKQLLAYKEHSDGASKLEKRSRKWQQHYPRIARDVPARTKNLAEEEIREVELWDLVSAFGRIIKMQTPQAKQEIVYDETPISTHMKRIYYRLKREERLTFRSLFTPEQHRTALLGIFLAILELVRHEYAYVSQKELFGEIELTYRQGSKPLEFADITNYESVDSFPNAA